MKALLLSAGRGERLRPLTDNWPKCLMPIRGIPLLGYWLRKFSLAGLDKVFVNTHWQCDPVFGYLNIAEHGVLVEPIYEPCLLGTAGTLRLLKNELNDDSFIVAHGDNYTDLDLNRLIDFHGSHNKPISMVTFQTRYPERSGIVEISSEGILIDFHEKVANPPSNNANAAIYVFDPIVLEVIMKDETILDISVDLIPRFLGNIKCFSHNGFNIDIGSSKELVRAQKNQINVLHTPKGKLSQFLKIFPEFKRVNKRLNHLRYILLHTTHTQVLLQ